MVDEITPPMSRVIRRKNLDVTQYAVKFMPLNKFQPMQ